jgi:hypothetical protein
VGRRGRLGRLAVAGIVVAAVAGVLGYSRVADPLLATGSSAVGSADRRPAEDGGPDTYTVPYADGADVSWAVSVQNTSLLPVSIRGIAGDEPGFRSLVGEATLHRTNGDFLRPADLPPFAPFELAPGDSAFLVVTEPFVDCATAATWYAPGTSVGLEDVVLNVSVLGLERRSTVTLPFHLQVQAPEDCPP